MKLLKITLPTGVEQLVPNNPKNKKYWELRQRKVGAERSQKYKIEEVEVDDAEALEIGFGVPNVKAKPKVDSNELMAGVMAQNAQLIALLTAKEETKTKK